MIRVPGAMLLLHPVMFPELGVQVHVKSVPAICEVRVRLVDWLLHCCWVFGVFERSGTGLMVTT